MEVEQDRKRFRRYHVAWLRRVLVSLLIVPQISVAAQEVVIVGDEGSVIHRRFLDGFEQQVLSSGANLALRYIPHERLVNHKAEISAASLVVTVGIRAAQALNGQDTPVPAFNALISKSDEAALPYLRGKGGSVSTLYIDQPPRRMVSLVKAALPRVGTLIIAVGERSQQYGEEIEASCSEVRIDCETMLIEDITEIDNVMEHAAHAGRVLMVIPDPLVVKASTAKALILGAYRRGISLIGYSQALVKAGALMAVHSTPEQLGMDAANKAIGALASRPLEMARGYYPTSFTVSVNYQLARALRLEIASEEALERTIKKAERNE